ADQREALEREIADVPGDPARLPAGGAEVPFPAVQRARGLLQEVYPVLRSPCFVRGDMRRRRRRRGALDRPLQGQEPGVLGMLVHHTPPLSMLGGVSPRSASPDRV